MKQVGALAQEVRRQCDGVDGVVDGIVSSPELCVFDFGWVACGNGTAGDHENCLSLEQVDTVRRVYEGWRGTDGRVLYPGLELGSEGLWWLLLGNKQEPSPLGVGWQRDFLMDDAAWDWRGFDEDGIVRLADGRDPGRANAVGFEGLGRFRDRGGKLVLYHGLADGLVPAKGSELFYKRTVEALGGGEISDFMRLFLVPGMQHCWSTDTNAPWCFGGATHAGGLGMDKWSVPGYKDSRHDAMMALVEWVERGRPVDSIVATAWRSKWNATSGALRQRPLCPYPAKAVYNGVGDVDLGSSWKCSGALGIKSGG
ncbi:hypothetical protein OQA88_1278 [Cercophora sp. LCS_1]